MNYDFSGWATRAGILCSDGRTIMNDAFKDNDGKKVPLVWNHQHDNPDNVLGHAILENRGNGVYAYCTFNHTPRAQAAKEQVMHGDITSLSIWANKLKQVGGNVVHGAIREVSLVLAGANPGAYIDSIMAHGECSEDEAIIYNPENKLELVHSEEDGMDDINRILDTMNEEQLELMDFMIEQAANGEMAHSDEQESDGMPNQNQANTTEKTVADVFETLTEEQKTAVYALIGAALEEKGDGENMKHNVFDGGCDDSASNYLSHSDMTEIISLAKSSGCGSLQAAIATYTDGSGALAHGIDSIEELFPEYKNVSGNEPELWTRDQGWVDTVMNGVSKSPISRIRTQAANAKGNDIRARGYGKGKKKNEMGNLKLLGRTTDPQTVFCKDALHRDDIIDIEDFDVVNYQYKVMRQTLNEELATAFLLGDGREEGDENKIQDVHIRPVWTDDELYTIHTDIDIAAARSELQGSDTSKRFGENYVLAEAVIAGALYAREEYRGTGTPDFFCTPHMLNVMLLARDLNGRRIYDSKTDLAAALNVGNIHTAEQFEGKIRTDSRGGKHKLLGIFINLKDYQVGSAKGGEIAKFEDFDIDFNQYKYLIETRLSGALVKIKSAIVLEEPVTSAGGNADAV